MEYDPANKWCIVGKQLNPFNVRGSEKGNKTGIQKRNGLKHSVEIEISKKLMLHSTHKKLKPDQASSSFSRKTEDIYSHHATVAAL